MYAQDSIDLLIKSGINFQKHEDFGIDIHRFGELLISSGFVLLDEVKWISFHRYMEPADIERWSLKISNIAFTNLSLNDSLFFDYLGTLADTTLVISSKC